MEDKHLELPVVLAAVEGWTEGNSTRAVRKIEADGIILGGAN